jgi:hypothetical protein
MKLAWWYTPETPVTEDVEIDGTWFEASPGKVSM